MVSTITKQVHLNDFDFLAQNHISISKQVQADDYHKLAKDNVTTWHKDAMKAVRKSGKIDAMDPVLSHFSPGGNLGSTSEAFAQELKKVWTRYLFPTIICNSNSFF
jgi:hypothetical protein